MKTPYLHLKPIAVTVLTAVLVLFAAHHLTTAVSAAPLSGANYGSDEQWGEWETSTASGIAVRMKSDKPISGKRFWYVQFRNDNSHRVRMRYGLNTDRAKVKLDHSTYMDAGEKTQSGGPFPEDEPTMYVERSSEKAEK